MESGEYERSLVETPEETLAGVDEISSAVSVLLQNSTWRSAPNDRVTGTVWSKTGTFHGSNMTDALYNVFTVVGSLTFLRGTARIPTGVLARSLLSLAYWAKPTPDLKRPFDQVKRHFRAASQAQTGKSMTLDS